MSSRSQYTPGPEMTARLFNSSLMRALFSKIRSFTAASEEDYLRKLRPLAEYSEVIATTDMGRGVALTEPVGAGTILGVYPGKRVTARDFAEKGDFTARAVRSAFRHGSGLIFDPTDFFGFVPDRPEARIALINEPPPGMNLNTVPIAAEHFVWFVTISDLAPGMQLFTTYGEQYQRHYPCDVERLKKPKFSAAELACLQTLGSRHPWLVEGIRELCAP